MHTLFWGMEMELGIEQSSDCGTRKRNMGMTYLKVILPELNTISPHPLSGSTITYLKLTSAMMAVALPWLTCTK